MNREVLTEEWAKRGWDGIVVLSAENVFYLSGSPTALTMKDFQQARPNSPRLVMVVQPSDEEATLITPAMDEGVNRAGAWVKDVRSYQEYAVSPMESLAQVLKDRGLSMGRIGLEMAALGVPQFQLLAAALPDATLEDCGPFMAHVRSIKMPEEVAVMKEGVDLMDDAYAESFSAARVGDTELKLDRRMFLNLMDRGFQRITGWTYIGEGAADIHRMPSDQKRLEPGEIVRTDYVAHFRSYSANLSRVAVAGEPDTEQQAVYEALLEIERRTAQLMRPGTRASDVYRYCHNAILQRGYEHPISLVGHNIGLNVHDLPMIVATDTTELRANMVICLEPVIGPYYHIQDEYVVTESGGQLLSGSFNTEQLFIIR